MSHFLLVAAHPSDQGLVVLMAHTMAGQLAAQGHTSTLLDLYRDEHTQEYMGRESGEIASKKLLYMQGLIAAADEIVLCYPVWYGGPPAILKNWMDENFTTHFAFVYRPASLWYRLSGQPSGMLTNKVLHQLITCGTPTWRYALAGNPFAQIITHFLVQFSGMKTGWTKVWGNIALIPKEQRVAQIVDKHKVWFENKIRVM
jgi:NAD(P)H dehydrogenase (quinone)